MTPEEKKAFNIESLGSIGVQKLLFDSIVYNNLRQIRRALYGCDAKATQPFAPEVYQSSPEWQNNDWDDWLRSTVENPAPTPMTVAALFASNPKVINLLNIAGARVHARDMNAAAYHNPSQKVFFGSGQWRDGLAEMTALMVRPF